MSGARSSYGQGDGPGDEQGNGQGETKWVGRAQDRACCRACGRVCSSWCGTLHGDTGEEEEEKEQICCGKEEIPQGAENQEDGSQKSTGKKQSPGATGRNFQASARQGKKNLRPQPRTRRELPLIDLAVDVRLDDLCDHAERRRLLSTAADTVKFVEAVWASSELTNGQKKATSNMFVCHTVTQRLGAPSAAFNPGNDEEVQLGQNVLGDLAGFIYDIKDILGTAMMQPSADLHDLLKEAKSTKLLGKELCNKVQKFDNAYRDIRHNARQRMLALKAKVLAAIQD